MTESRLELARTLRASEERADQLVSTFTGELSITNLGIASGYVGSIVPTIPQRITRNGSFSITFEVEVTDDQIRKFEDRCSTSPAAGFDLSLNLGYETIDPSNNISHDSVARGEIGSTVGAPFSE